MEKRTLELLRFVYIPVSFRLTIRIIMALRSTQPLTEMSTRSISWGKGGWCVRLTTYQHPVPTSQNLWALTSWNPLGLSRPVMGLLYRIRPSYAPWLTHSSLCIYIKVTQNTVYVFNPWIEIFLCKCHVFCTLTYEIKCILFFQAKQ